MKKVLTVSFDFCQAAVSIKINNLLICFYNFDLYCPILEKDNFIECLFFLTLFVLI